MSYGRLEWEAGDAVFLVWMWIDVGRPCAMTSMEHGGRCGDGIQEVADEWDGDGTTTVNARREMIDAASTRCESRGGETRTDMEAISVSRARDFSATPSRGRFRSGSAWSDVTIHRYNATAPRPRTFARRIPNLSTIHS